MLRVLWSTVALSGTLAVSAMTLGAQTPGSDDNGQQIYHLNASTQEVVVDVVVTDDKGRPVHGLTRKDFTLLEDNKPQSIRGFSEHVGPTAEELAKTPPMPKLPKGTFTNYTPVDSDQTLNVLLIDSLNTATADQSFVRDQLKKYLNSAKPGERIAIFGLTTHLLLLQGFTADPSILKDIVDKKNPMSSVLLDDPNGNNVDSVGGFMGDDPEMASVATSYGEFQQERQSFQMQLRVQYTLDAMSDLARYLSSLPGRKNLIWFSSAFPVTLLPDGNMSNPFEVAGSSDAEFRQTVNLLARAQVAVYPVDAQGLAGSTVFSAGGGTKFGKSITNFGTATQAFLDQNAVAHTTMMQMAEATGGHAYLNTNGLAQAVRSAIDLGQNYYTLTYSPAGGKWNGNYRKISVKLDQPYTLAYRRGYFADDPAEQKRTIEEITGGDIPPQDAQSLGMMRGAPDPTQITLKVMVLPSTAPPSDEVAKGNALNPCAVASKAPKSERPHCSDSIKVKGPYKNYEVTIAANPVQVSFQQTTGGDRFAALEFVTYVYDKDGNLVLLKDDFTHSQLTPEKYARLLRGSAYWHQEISVPDKGEYFLRIGVHDMLTDKMGGVEVPISSVEKLPPVAPVVQPTATAAPPAPAATK